MELSTKGSGAKKTRKKEGVPKVGSMEVSTRATGRTTKRTVEVVSFMPMVTFTLANGKTIKHMATEYTTIQTVLNTRAGGSKISNTARVRKCGQTMRATRVLTKKEKSTGLASSTGLMDLRTQVTLLTTIWKETASTPGAMVASSTGNGKTIRCTARVSLRGRTADAIKESTTVVKSTVTEFTLGQTTANTRASGKMESNTALAFSLPAKVKQRGANGQIANVSSGMNEE
jgi:hypothetical protein